MIWDFAEANILSESSGGFQTICEGQARAIHSALGWVYSGSESGITDLDATKNSYPVRPVVISTDPPYYDNIGYAVLSDFFYAWLKRSLETIWPALFRRLVTPKDDELVATPYRHGGQQQADNFFVNGMREAMSAMGTAATESHPLTIYTMHSSKLRLPTMASPPPGGLPSYRRLWILGWLSTAHGRCERRMQVDW